MKINLKKLNIIFCGLLISSYLYSMQNRSLPSLKKLSAEFIIKNVDKLSKDNLNNLTLSLKKYIFGLNFLNKPYVISNPNMVNLNISFFRSFINYLAEISPLYSAFTCMNFSPDGSVLAIGNDNGEIYIKSALNFYDDEMYIFKSHYSPVNYLHFISNNQLISLDQQGIFKIWNVGLNKMSLIKSINGGCLESNNLCPIRDYSFQEAKNYMAIVEECGLLRIYDLNEKSFFNLPACEKIYGCAFINNEHIAVTTKACYLEIFNIKDKNDIHLKASVAIDKDDYSLFISPLDIFVVGKSKDRIIVWDKITFDQLFEFDFGEECVSMSFSPNAKWLFALMKSGDLLKINMEANIKMFPELPDHSRIGLSCHIVYRFLDFINLSEDHSMIEDTYFLSLGNENEISIVNIKDMFKKL